MSSEFGSPLGLPAITPEDKMEASIESLKGAAGLLEEFPDSELAKEIVDELLVETDEDFTEWLAKNGCSACGSTARGCCDACY